MSCASDDSEKIVKKTIDLGRYFGILKNSKTLERIELDTKRIRDQRK